MNITAISVKHMCKRNLNTAVHVTGLRDSLRNKFNTALIIFSSIVHFHFCFLCRCVNQFDHHCQWLNNCVGKENYKLFLALIIAVLINSIIYCVFLSMSLGETYSSSQKNNELFKDYSNSRYLSMKIVVWIWLIVVGIIGALDLNLLMFHLWLHWHNLSTYDYICNSRTAHAVIDIIFILSRLLRQTDFFPFCF